MTCPTFAEGARIRNTATSAIDWIHGGQRHHVKTPADLMTLGYDWIDVAPACFDAIPAGRDYDPATDAPAVAGSIGAWLAANQTTAIVAAAAVAGLLLIARSGGR